jgi:sterol desaturase/sphingolipid hydroxylase (fatty acid hydroxylase superfamily)
MMDLNLKIWILLASLSTIFLFEKLKPQIIGKKISWRHDWVNLGMGLFNNSALAYIFFKVNSIYTGIIKQNDIGILNVLGVGDTARLAISFLALDISLYTWHLLLHKSDFLYRFHAVHHTDREMNVTTAFRFHFGELIMGNFFRFLIIAVFGLSIKEIVIYEVVLNINVYIHHSNLKISPVFDKVASNIVITPYVHRVHHSVVFTESNSNYGSVFVFWDKLFMTYMNPKGNSIKRFGDPNFKNERCQSFFYMLVQPFRSRKNIGF